jgi:cell filamentation protein
MQIEREISEDAARRIDFALPPYDLAYLKQLHHSLFGELYDWAGEIRTIDLSKGSTRFCTVNRIAPESTKIFQQLSSANWLEGMNRRSLVDAVAQCYGDLNVVHPFREGNGRAQRLLFEHLIINAGFEIDWWHATENEWLQASIDAVSCDYRALTAIFDKCIGSTISA